MSCRVVKYLAVDEFGDDSLLPDDRYCMVPFMDGFCVQRLH